MKLKMWPEMTDDEKRRSKRNFLIGLVVSTSILLGWCVPKLVAQSASPTAVVDGTHVETIHVRTTAFVKLAPPFSAEERRTKIGFIIAWAAGGVAAAGWIGIFYVLFKKLDKINPKRKSEHRTSLRNRRWFRSLVV